MAKVKTIDLRQTNYTVTELDLINEQLKKDNLYRSGLLYRGFNGEKLEIILKEGTDNPKSNLIYCSTELEIKEELENPESTENAINHASLQRIPALAIYDFTKLIAHPLEAYNYKFINPDNKLEALVAVYLLKMCT